MRGKKKIENAIKAVAWSRQPNGSLPVPGDASWASSVLTRVKRGARRGEPKLDHPFSPRIAQKQIKPLIQGLSDGPSLLPYLLIDDLPLPSRDQLRAVYEAISTFGLAALTSPVVPINHPLSLSSDPQVRRLAAQDKKEFGPLREAVGGVLTLLYVTARQGDAKTRAKAARRLAIIFRALIPEQRGVGKVPAIPRDTLVFMYYEQLLRWEMILPYLQEHPRKDGRFRQLVSDAAKAYGLKVDDVRLYLMLDDKFARSRNTMATREATQMARGEVALQVGLTTGTINKKLSVRGYKDTVM